MLITCPFEAFEVERAWNLINAIRFGSDSYEMSKLRRISFISIGYQLIEYNFLSYEYAPARHFLMPFKSFSWPDPPPKLSLSSGLVPPI